MTSHFNQEAAGRWAAGVLDDAEAQQLETHAASCPSCERLLQAEARAQLVLESAVKSAVLPSQGVAQVVPLRPRRAALAVMAGAGLALAASIGWLIAGSVPAEPVAPLLTQVDAGGVEPSLQIPHYEEGVAIPSEALVALEPFKL